MFYFFPYSTSWYWKLGGPLDSRGGMVKWLRVSFAPFFHSKGKDRGTWGPSSDILRHLVSGLKCSFSLGTSTQLKKYLGPTKVGWSILLGYHYWRINQCSLIIDPIVTFIIIIRASTQCSNYTFQTFWSFIFKKPNSYIRRCTTPFKLIRNFII